MSKKQRVVHTAEQRLDDSSHLFRQAVSCDYEDGVLRLNGKVPSFYLKQMAQTLITNIDGVRRVDNAIIVANPAGISSEPACV